MNYWVATYTMDLGYQFPLAPIEVKIAPNSPTTAFDENSILPSSYKAVLKKLQFNCPLCGIIPRRLEVVVNSGHKIWVDFPLQFGDSFAQQIIEDFKNQPSITEVVKNGEKVNYSTYKEILWQ